MNLTYLARSKVYGQNLWITDLGLDWPLMLSNCKNAQTSIFLMSLLPHMILSSFLKHFKIFKWITSIVICPCR